MNSPKTGIHAEDPDSTCLPITNLEELWSYMAKPPAWGRDVIPRVQRGGSFKNIPFGEYYCHVNEHDWRQDIEQRLRDDRMGINAVRTELLVCHDMKNGYLHDRFINGSSAFHSYRFYRWSAIDIFVYFSHHLITIPPLGWINAAHKHGVKILGTFITEWDVGRQLCDAILSSDQTIDVTINSLVQITRYFKLDGWLLNIENHLSDGNKMVNFVQRFTNALHNENPDSRVIWYDSVRVDGKLQWQNELNDNNKPFYDVCDGIFLNYTWKEHNLQRSLAACGSGSAYKVYVGIDVFGRNQYGGGGFKTQLAVNLVYKYGFSTALFAPGWTHEAICRKPSKHTQENAPLVDKITNTARNIVKICKSSPFVQAAMNITSSESGENTSSTSEEKDIPSDLLYLDLFLAREELFWSLILRYYRTHEIVQLPLITSFCQGSGLYFNRKAEYISDQPWFNIKAQDVQLSVPFCPLRYDFDSILNLQDSASDLSAANIQAISCLEYEFADSFNGGSCLKLTKLDNQNLITRLFITNFFLEKSMIVIIVSKKISYGCLDLLMLAEREDYSTTKIILGGNDNCNPFEEFNLPNVYSSGVKINDYTLPSLTHWECTRASEVRIKAASGEKLKAALVYLLKYYPEEYFYFATRNYWMTNYYIVPCSRLRIREIAVKVEGPVESTVLLGHLALIPYK